MVNDIFLMYRNGEIIPFIILAVVCVGYVVIFERFIILQIVYKINFEKYNTNIRKMLSANDLERARNFSKATSKTALPMLAVKAIDVYETDPMRVRATLSEEGLRFFPRIRRRLSQLPNLASACVLLGAAAAVQGIWSSFRVSEGLELGVKSFAFSSGLSHALLPLGVSLISAILLMLPYGILEAIAWRLEAEIEHSLCIILNILSPEMQPMFAGAAPVVQENTNDSNHQFVNHDNNDNAKERKNDDANASTAQEVPDEEEII